MTDLLPDLLPDLVFRQAERSPEATALVARDAGLAYGALAERVRGFARVLLQAGLAPGDRVGVFLDKRVETVVAKFGAAAAGCTFVPINPLFRPRHVGHVLRDCNARVLVTSGDRLATVAAVLADCRDLALVVLVEGAAPEAPAPGALRIVSWEEALAESAGCTRPPHRRIDADMTAIFYTSGSTGMPKGVVLSHRNLVVGARSVSTYLENHAGDRLLAALPLSFDAGFSQLTTAFTVGASVVLLNYLMPRDVINAIVRHGITGLTGVPPLYIQLAQSAWPDPAPTSLRYVANTGGRMPGATLAKLRERLPGTRFFLMYGLTEAFRSTYLPPSEVDRRPDSMGKAIPNVEVMVVDANGRPCAPGEEGELVHRGPLVSLGYWNDPARTAERFKPAPGQPAGLCLPEIAVWSGDVVRTDDEGFLYFVGRRDDMIKTSGNRVSPTEVEEVVHGTGLVKEVAAIGAPHEMLGQGIVLYVTARDGVPVDVDALLAECRSQLPAFMVPHAVVVRPTMPINANGKIDRSLLRDEAGGTFVRDGA